MPGVGRPKRKRKLETKYKKDGGVVKHLLIFIVLLILFGCSESMRNFKFGDRITSEGGRPGTILDVRDGGLQIEVLVKWDDNKDHPEWHGFGMVNCAQEKCGTR